MKLINYFSSNARQWDKIATEWRIGGITLFEFKSDLSKRCFKLVILNFGFRTDRCKCSC